MPFVHWLVTKKIIQTASKLYLRMKKYFFFFASLLFIQKTIIAQNNFPYKNTSLPHDERVKDLLQRITPEEKF